MSQTDIASADSASKYCLSKTHMQQDLEHHYSMDFNLETGVDRAGWTWVATANFDGEYDHLISPQKDKIRQLPELYSNPCSNFARFLGECQRTGSSFSKSIGTVFIEGHRANLLGLPQNESYAIYGETIIPLPSTNLNTARYRGEIPSKNLVALHGLNGELLIFDGKDIHSVKAEKALARNDSYPSWAIENDPVTNRDFVISNGLIGTTPFLYEIKDNLKLNEIALDPAIDAGPLRIFTIKGDTQSWLIERDGIYIEDGNKFRRVAHRSATVFITAPAQIGLADNGSIYFQFQTDESEKLQPYLLQRTSESCDIPLDTNKDIELRFD